MKLFRAILILLAALTLGNGGMDAPAIQPEATRQPIPFEELTLTSVFLTYGGYTFPVTLEAWASEDGRSAVVCDHRAEVTKTRRVPIDILYQAQALMEQYEVYQWDGFNESDSMILDGESFTFSAAFSDGSSLSAYGNNRFPANYFDFRSELTELLQSAFLPEMTARPGIGG